MKIGFLVVGTDTEVGKTHQSVALAGVFQRLGYSVAAYKPAASGLAIDDCQSDPYQLAVACNLSLELLPRICPQSFSAALAPPMAAKLEGRVVDQQLLVEGARWWFDRCDVLLIEGAGGVLSPVSDRHNILDLAEHWKLPLILVAANRLGCINHTLLSVEAIERRNLELACVILNGWPIAKDAHLSLLQQTNFEFLKASLPKIPVVQEASQVVEVLTMRKPA